MESEQTVILAQLGGYSWVHLAIMVVIIAACCGLVLVAVRQFGLTIPGWLVQVFWIVVAACVIIFAIRLVASM